MAESEDALFGSCKENVEKDAKALQCDGFCDKWFHIKCINMNGSKYDMVKKLLKEVIWMCQDCKFWMKEIVKIKPDKIIKVCSNSGNICDETLLAEINDRVKNLEIKIDKSSKVLAPKMPTYAEIAKLNVENKENICNEGIIIKPKKENPNINTKEVVQQSIDPSRIGVPIKKIKIIKEGAIIIKSDNKAHIDKLAQEARNKLGSNFEVRITKQRNPTICIPRMKKEYTSDRLINELRGLNYEINEEDELKVVYCRKNNKTQRFTLYIEVNGSLFSKINNKYINTGWDLVLVREDFGIVRCSKCQRFNHKVCNCTAEFHTCKKCGEHHDMKECSNQMAACINCNLNSKFAQNC